MRALAKKMLRRKIKDDIIEAAYNRYALWVLGGAGACRFLAYGCPPPVCLWALGAAPCGCCRLCPWRLRACVLHLHMRVAPWPCTCG